MKKFIRELNHLRWIEKELQKITSFPTVGNRIRFSKMFNSKGNVARLNCIHLGMKRMYGGKLSITNRSKDGRFRNLEYLIYDYLKIYYPSLPYNQVLINKNNWLGNYTGGELNTHYEDKTLEQTHNIRYRPILFKNKTTYHSVNKWIGNRYSIITYLI